MWWFLLLASSAALYPTEFRAAPISEVVLHAGYAPGDGTTRRLDETSSESTTIVNADFGVVNLVTTRITNDLSTMTAESTLFIPFSMIVTLRDDGDTKYTWDHATRVSGDAESCSPECKMLVRARARRYDVIAGCRPITNEEESGSCNP